MNSIADFVYLLNSIDDNKYTIHKEEVMHGILVVWATIKNRKYVFCKYIHSAEILCFCALPNNITLIRMHRFDYEEYVLEFELYYDPKKSPVIISQWDSVSKKLTFRCYIPSSTLLTSTMYEHGNIMRTVEKLNNNIIIE